MTPQRGGGFGPGFGPGILGGAIGGMIGGMARPAVPDIEEDDPPPRVRPGMRERRPRQAAEPPLRRPPAIERPARPDMAARPRRPADVAPSPVARTRPRAIERAVRNVAPVPVKPIPAKSILAKPILAPPAPPRPPKPVAAAPARLPPPMRAVRATPPRAPAPSTPAPRPALAEQPGIVPGEVLIELKPDAPADALARLARRERLIPIGSDRFTLAPLVLHRFRIRDRRGVSAVVAALQADARIASAQPNHAYMLVGESGAARPFADAQYAVAKLHFDEAHRAATGRGVTVAVIDSGVDGGHPALADALGPSFDAIDKTEPPAAAASARAHAHGTAIAGLIGARTLLASAAPDARLLAIRAFSGSTDAKPGAQGTTVHVLRALDWAAAAGARVVNMSFAGPPDALMARLLAAGAGKGVVYVAAAGNAGPDAAPLHPAADPSVLAVTATDAEDRIFPAANRGAHIAVAAPGVDTFVAAPGGAYGYASGTSMAAPQVSGVVALMLQAKPDATPAALREALTRGVRDLGAPGRDDVFGAGLVDAREALRALGVGEPAPTPASTPALAAIGSPAAPDAPVNDPATTPAPDAAPPAR